jgi:osmotically inducible protein OsmC
MPIRSADAEWKGALMDGAGKIKLGSGSFEGQYSFRTRFADGVGTNPEELIAGAHAGCFTMALSAQLGGSGFTPTSIHTVAKVHLEKAGEGFAIPRIDLDTEAVVPGISPEVFEEQAQTAKKNCPVSKLFAGADIHLNAKLLPA